MKSSGELPRRPSAIATFLCATAVTWSAAFAQSPSLAGTWRLDRDASEVGTAVALAGLGDGGAPAYLHVIQAANGALILSSRVNAAGPRVYQIGGDSDVPAPNDQAGTMKVTARWEGGALVIEGSKELDSGGRVGIEEVLSLGPDGRTLTIEATVTGVGGAGTNRLVYRRET